MTPEDDETGAETPAGGAEAPDELAAAFGLLMQGELEAARRAFARLVSGLVYPPAALLEGYGLALIACCDTTESIRTFEKAYATYRREGNVRKALQCAVALVNLTAALGEEAAANGWEQTGNRLADEIGPSVERGYLALARTGCQVADPRELAERSETALAIAREFGDRDLELRALGDKGLALVSLGSVGAGFQLLDEVMVAVVSGEMQNPETQGKTVCAMLGACERTGDVNRAEYWSRRIEELPFLRIPILFAHCALVQGAIDSLRGRWDEAEQRLLEGARSDSPYKVESIAKLAELLLQQGRITEAADLLMGYEDRFVCQPALAQLRMHQGNCNEASALLRSVVRALGDDCIRRAFSLSLLIKAELGRGDLAGARDALEPLRDLEMRSESNEIRAIARLAGGRIACTSGAYNEARTEFETALALLIHYDRPLLSAEIRLQLAYALSQAGEPVAALVEVDAALAGFRRLGLRASEMEAEALRAQMAGLGAGPDRSAAPAFSQSAAVEAERLTRRETEIAHLVATGLTNREIAERLVLSVRTVETHVDRILGKLDLHTRTQLAHRMRSAGPGNT